MQELPTVGNFLNFMREKWVLCGFRRGKWECWQLECPKMDVLKMHLKTETSRVCQMYGRMGRNFIFFYSKPIEVDI